MPLSREEFNKYKNPLVYIQNFLEKHKGSGYTSEEIAEELGIEELVVQRALNSIDSINYTRILLGMKEKYLIESVYSKGKTYYRYISN